VKIGVMADSHGNRAMVQRAVNRMGKADMLFHLGDRYGDLCAPGAVSLKGNCDFEKDAPLDWTGTLAGISVYATHGHLYGVKSGPDRLLTAARQNGWQLVLYGHTHVPEHIVQGDTVLVNPGSLVYPRSELTRTAAVVEIADGHIHVGFIVL
jgi:putative phosphoesterase